MEEDKKITDALLKLSIHRIDLNCRSISQIDIKAFWIITLLVGIISFVLKFTDLGQCNLPFVVFLVLSVVSIIFAIISAFPRDFFFGTKITKLVDRLERGEKHEAIQKTILSGLARATDKNTQILAEKSRYLKLASVFMLISLVSLLFANMSVLNFSGGGEDSSDEDDLDIMTFGEDSENVQQG